MNRLSIQITDADTRRCADYVVSFATARRRAVAILYSLHQTVFLIAVLAYICIDMPSLVLTHVLPGLLLLNVLAIIIHRGPKRMAATLLAGDIKPGNHVFGPGAMEITFDRESICMLRPDELSMRFVWRAVKRVDVREDGMFIAAGQRNSWVVFVPARAFAESAERVAFQQAVERHWRASRAVADDASAKAVSGESG